MREVPVSVFSTETGTARCLETHALRGFQGIPRRVKTREKALAPQKTVEEDAPSIWLDGTPDPHL